MTVSATQLQNLVQAVGGRDGEPPVLVVDCPECWFPGGAPVVGEAAAARVADAHDRAAHCGSSTADIRPAFEVFPGSDTAR